MSKRGRHQPIPGRRSWNPGPSICPRFCPIPPQWQRCPNPSSDADPTREGLRNRMGSGVLKPGRIRAAPGFTCGASAPRWAVTGVRGSRTCRRRTTPCSYAYRGQDRGPASEWTAGQAVESRRSDRPPRIIEPSPEGVDGISLEELRQDRQRPSLALPVPAPMTAAQFTITVEPGSGSRIQSCSAGSPHAPKRSED